MQSPVDPPKGDHDAFGKEILAGISFLFFRTDFGDNDQNLQRSVFDSNRDRSDEGKSE